MPVAAAAQWQWIDKDGRKVFSDQAPPPDVAPNKILRRPGGRAAVPEETSAAASPSATASAPKLSVAKPSGKDPALEAKRKEMEATEAKKTKAEEEQLAADRSDNCTRAKAAKGVIDSGQRMARINAKGEREFLDDGQRAAEAKRLDAVIARDCTARDRQ